MKRYLRNGFIQSALIIVGIILIPELFNGRSPTVGSLIVDAAILLFAVALALCGFRSVRMTPQTDEAQRS